MPFGQFTLCRACGDETACVAARYLTLRIVRERHERKNPLSFSFFTAVAGLWLAPDYLRKGEKIRGWKTAGCLPSCAPVNSVCSFEQTRPNPRTRDSDAKYKTKTEDVPVLGLQTVQTGRKKEPYFRTAPQKFTSADIHLRTARQARLHARECLLQCRSCCP